MKYCLNFLVVLLLANTAWSQTTVTYDSLSPDQVVKKHFTRTFQPDGGKVECTVRWNAEGNTGLARYQLDENYATLSYRYEDPAHNTDYQCERSDKVLHVVGKSNGKAVDKKINIGDLPFLFDPTLGLQGFVLSDKSRITFCVINPADWAVHHMTAEKKERQEIMLHEKSVPAVRVHWSLAGLMSVLYNRELWFDPQTGTLLKSDVSDGCYDQITTDGLDTLSVETSSAGQ